MTVAVATIERLSSYGARFILEGEDLILDVLEDFPSSLIEEVRQAKAEIIGYMKKEIDWRVDIMRKQLANHKGKFFPLLTAREDVDSRTKLRCFSCGLSLEDVEASRCSWCRSAVTIVLDLI